MKALFLVFLLLFSSVAFADEYPAQPFYKWTVTGHDCSTYDLSTLPGCIVNARNAIEPGFIWSWDTWVSPVPPPYHHTTSQSRTFRLFRDNGSVVNTSNDNVYVDFICRYGGQEVTSTSNPKYGMCINVDPCPEGYIRNEFGACVPEPETCEPGPDEYTGMKVSVPGDVSNTCIDGCSYPLHSTLSVHLNPDGWITSGVVGNNSGESCTASDFPAPNQEETPEDKCAKQGKSFGIVNGAVVCVEPGTPGSAPVKQSTESSSETVISVTNEGDTITTTTNTSTSTTITTNGSGGVTATTTTTTQNPDGSSTVTTSTQEMPMPEFCALNPNHSLCKSEPKTDCDKYPDSLACQILGEAPELTEADGLQTIEREIGSIVLPSLPQSSGCPAPLTYSIAGRPITVSFQPVCEYAEAFHPLVVAAAWLSAAFIVVGARKDL